MSDRATPNLPSRDFAATVRFYARLGFVETFRDDGWLILERGPIQLEFFPWPQLNPRENIASCCIRVADADWLYAAFREGLSQALNCGIPRITPPMSQPWGLREFAVVDPDGNLLRCLAPLPAVASHSAPRDGGGA
jgi:catechol 2,3-dioxygenase-like lactoylglutathione lyase family enzyme